jgi:lysophospholipase L1-like esterase
MVLGTPLIFLFLLEFVLRVATTGSFYLTESNPHFVGPDGITRLLPNQRTWWYGCDYSVNSNGFRMPHEVGPKRGLRILGIGDSVTLGMGVKRTEDAWANWLETITHQRGFGSVEVLNSGVQGWNLLVRQKDKLVPAEFTRFVTEEGPKVAPDLVVYCICLNDVPSQVEDLFVIDNGRNKARFKLFPESAREWFKRKAVYRLARDAFREARFRSLDFSGLLNPPEADTFWDMVASEIGRLKHATEALNARLYCVIVPYSYQLLPGNKKLLNINEHWHQVLNSNGIPWLDITEDLTEANVLQYYALGDYIHLNTKGHHLIAERAFKLIEPSLKRPSSP